MRLQLYPIFRLARTVKELLLRLMLWVVKGSSQKRLKRREETGKSNWKGLKTIIAIESQREAKGTTETERRFYLCSSDDSAKKLLLATRSHWGIENRVHWVLDMSFNEDQIRIRKGNAPQNMSVVRHVALNMIQSYKKPRQSIKR